MKLHRIPFPSYLIALSDPPHPPSLLILIAQVRLDLGHVKLLASASLEDVQHVQAGRLKVRGRVIRLRNEDLRLQTVVHGLVVVGHGHKLLVDRSQQVQARLDLRLGIARLHRGRDHADEPSLGRHLMRVADERHVNVALAVHLLLWNDDLRGQGVLRVRDRMVQDADAAHHLALLPDLRKLKLNCVILKFNQSSLWKFCQIDICLHFNCHP